MDHLNSFHEQSIAKERFIFQSEQELKEFIDSIPDGRFINRKGKVQRHQHAALSFVCIRSKESLRYKEVARNDRPVRTINSTKRDFNCLAFISARVGSSNSVDVEFLDYHTCCKGDDLDISKLRLRQAVKK